MSLDRSSVSRSVELSSSSSDSQSPPPATADARSRKIEPNESPSSSGVGFASRHCRTRSAASSKPRPPPAPSRLRSARELDEEVDRDDGDDLCAVDDERLRAPLRYRQLESYSARFSGVELAPPPYL